MWSQALDGQVVTQAPAHRAYLFSGIEIPPCTSATALRQFGAVPIGIGH